MCECVVCVCGYVTVCVKGHVCAGVCVCVFKVLFYQAQSLISVPNFIKSSEPFTDRRIVN